MIRRYLALCIFLFFTNQLKAQQYGLFNTGTLFDAFENPAQKAFILDSSRHFASNFFLPYFGLNAANKGDANSILQRALSESIYSTTDLPLGANKDNTIYENSNLYLFTFRIFKSYKYNKELGFSWQVRTDTKLDYTNETLAIFDNYHKFDNGAGTLYDDRFNDHGYVQSYHQFSINYRENYNKELAFGIKLSLLSGISYNNLDINHSSLSMDPELDNLKITLGGNYKASFLKFDEINKNTFFPTFKNPGLSIGLGTTYTSKKGLTIMGNLKDLGFIKWSKHSYDVALAGTTTIEDLSTKTPSKIQNEIGDIILKANDPNKGFYTLTNAKADFLLSKTFNFYTPGFILSKNLFYQGGDLALVNSFKYNNFSVSAIPDYNLNGLFMVGAQGMYKTPNFEFFMGSDNVAKTITIRQDNTGADGYLGASFYMGLSIKFGYTVEHPLNSSYMPGLNDEEEQSFFKRVFNVFKKKK